MRVRAMLVVCGAWTLALAPACGGEDEPSAQTKDASDTQADGGTGSDGGAGDGGADGASDAAADAVACGGLPICVDDNGIEDLARCPAPQSGYQCLDGCCVAKAMCKADSDCAASLGSDVCPDQRLRCACEPVSGACIQSACTADAQCPQGQLCNDGGCHVPVTTGLQVRLHRRLWIARPGDSGEPATLFGAQVVDDKLHVQPAATVEWAWQGSGFSLKDGKLMAGDVAGKGKAAASVAGGKAGDTAEAWNLGPLPAGVALRVTAIDEEALSPLQGKAWVVCDPEAATPTVVTATLADGQATWSNIKGNCDVHVVSPDHDAVSLLGVDIAAAQDIVVAARLRHYAALEFDIAGLPVEASSTLIHGSVLKGEVSYAGQGEAGLGITSTGLGSELLLFNLDALLGPNVKRPFHPDAPALVNPKPGQPQDIPGGVTFLLAKKVVDSYILAAPPGKRIVWSLAGRLPLTDLLSQVSDLVGAVKDGVDVGKVVGVLLPYLSGFSSQILPSQAFTDGSAIGAPAIKDLAPDMPLALTTEITPPLLPAADGGGFADLLLALAGALLPDGTVIPLGLAAGSDTANSSETPDGKVDGEPSEPGDQPLTLTSAPLHGGLRVGPSNRVVVTAAVVVGGKGKREGGSLAISEAGPFVETFQAPALLPLPAASSYQAGKRALAVAAVSGAHAYRVTLTGAKGLRWMVWVAPSATGKTRVLPAPADIGVDPSLAASPKRVFVSAFELRSKPTWEAALGDGTLLDLVRRTARTSFVDVH